MNCVVKSEDCALYLVFVRSKDLCFCCPTFNIIDNVLAANTINNFFVIVGPALVSEITKAEIQIMSKTKILNNQYLKEGLIKRRY